MYATVSEITQTGTAIIKNYTRQRIIELNTFDNVFSIVEWECSNKFSLKDMEHITNFIMGYVGLA